MAKPTMRTIEESAMIVLCSFSCSRVVLQEIQACGGYGYEENAQVQPSLPVIDRTGGDEEEQGYGNKPRGEPGQNRSRQPCNAPLHHRYTTVPGD
jgi:hypothetical protein